MAGLGKNGSAPFEALIKGVNECALKMYPDGYAGLV